MLVRDAKRITGVKFVRIFTLLGVKHAESSTLQQFKARIVCGGDRVWGAEGQDLSWQDTSSTPTDLATIKAIMIYSLLCGEIPSGSDCVAAYIQSKLPISEIVMALLPQECLSPAMAAAAARLGGPVCWRLRKSL